MSIREKALLGVMVVALGYGGWELFLPSSDGVKGGETLEQAAERARAFAQESLTAIRAEGPDELLGQAERRIAAPWPSNPFLVLRQKVDAPMGVATAIRFSGYITADGEMFAVIDGRLLRPGDVVRGSGYVVLSVATNRVVLTAADGGSNLVVRLENGSARRGEE